MARIVGHSAVGEPEARHRAARDATGARHFQAIRPLARGRAFVEAAEVLAFVPRRVEEPAARRNALGPEALGDRRRRRNGRPATLPTGAVLPAPAKRVRRPPGDGGVWSGPEVAAWVARRLGRQKAHPQRGWEALGRIGRSPQAPRPRPRHARAAGPEEQAAFKGGPRRRWRGPGRRIPAGRPGRGLGRGRAPPRPGAGPAPRPGASRPAACRPRPPPLRVAAGGRLRAADHRRDGVASRERPPEATPRGAARRLRAAGRRGPEAPHRPRAGQRRLARTGGPGRPRGDRPGVPAAYGPELPPAGRPWPLVDEAAANRHFATPGALDAAVARRCRRPDAGTVRPRTGFHWRPRPATPR